MLILQVQLIQLSILFSFSVPARVASPKQQNSGTSFRLTIFLVKHSVFYLKGHRLHCIGAGGDNTGPRGGHFMHRKVLHAWPWRKWKFYNCHTGHYLSKTATGLIQSALGIKLTAFLCENFRTTYRQWQKNAEAIPSKVRCASSSSICSKKKKKKNSQRIRQEGIAVPQ